MCEETLETRWQNRMPLGMGSFFLFGVTHMGDDTAKATNP